MSVRDSGVSVHHPAGNVAVVTVDRPPVNALDPTGYDVAAQLLHELDADPDTRAIVLTGAGDRAFTAGTDRASLGLAGTALDAAFAAARRLFSALAGLHTPLIGALNGPVIGGGVIVAAHCDLLLAVPGAYFAVPELSLGYPGGGNHLQLLFPRSVAMRMMLLGERLTAGRAQELGVVEVVEPERLGPAAVDCAATIAALDPAAVRDARALVRGADRAALDGYLAEMRVMERLMAQRRQRGEP